MFTLTCVVEDTARPTFRSEHGFAVWIITPDGQVLFDTGGSGAVLLHNLRRLSLDPATLDAVVISHGHNDHTGGLAALLPLLRPGTPLYAHPTLFRRRFSDHGSGPRDIGSPITREELVRSLDLRLSVTAQEVLPGIWTTGEITERPYPEGRSARHTILREQAHVPDPYEDDFSMVVETEQGIFLLCGCCHAGLLNTIAHVRQHWDAALIGVGGGTHLVNAESETLRQTVAEVTALPGIQAWIGHCSGDAFIAQLAAALPPERFERCAAGAVLRL